MSKLRAITELPFGLSGRIFRSPMPFSTFDPERMAYTEMKENRVQVVVILTEEDEYRQNTGEDLKGFYSEEGLHVIHLPIVDFGVPNREELDLVLDETLDFALNGRNVAVHCLAGIGRTGLFLASMAKRIFGYEGKEAILWVRQYVPDAVANIEQVRFLL